MLLTLEEARWLANCGKPVESGKARVLVSWNAAFKIASSSDMDDLLLEYSNRIRDDLQRTPAGKDAYHQWNEFVVDVKPDVEGLVHRKLDELTPLKNPQPILDSMNWILVGAALEIFYRRFSNRDFYQALCGWLVEGHLPLGWELGDYPDGRAVVY